MCGWVLLHQKKRLTWSRDENKHPVGPLDRVKPHFGGCFFINITGGGTGGGILGKEGREIFVGGFG